MSKFYVHFSRYFFIAVSLVLFSLSAKAQIGGPNGYTFGSTVNGGAWDTNFTSQVVWKSGTDLRFDSVSYPVAITLPGGGFTYNCRKYSTLRISTNGFVFFESPTVLAQNQYTVGLGASGSFTNTTVNAIAATTALYSSGVIQPFGVNLTHSKDVNAQSKIRYGNIGANNFVISFEDLSRPLATGAGDSSDRINFQIWLSASGSIRFIYGNCTPVASATSVTSPVVGLRGGHTSDWITRAVTGSAPNADWLSSTDGTGTAISARYAGNGAAAPNNVFPPLDLVYTFTPPPCNSPLYQSLPVFEDFENDWTGTPASNSNLPTASWNNWPGRGISSWRRDDHMNGVTTPSAVASVVSAGFNSASNWTVPATGIYFAQGAGALNSGHSARFHTAATPLKHYGDLECYFDPASCGSGIDLKLNYYYINASGTDSMWVFFSNDGGATFTRIDTANANFSPIQTAWAARNIVIPAALVNNSNTCVVRFRGISDHTTLTASDMGLDRVSITGNAAAPVISVTASDTLICSAGQGTVTSSTLSASGASTYRWYPSNSLSSGSGASVIASPKALTIYTVIASDAACNTASATVSVNNNGPLSFGFVTTPAVANICPNTDSVNINISDSSIGGGSYSVRYCDQFAINNGEEDIFNVKFPNTIGYPNAINNTTSCATSNVGSQGVGINNNSGMYNSYADWSGSTVPVPTVVAGNSYPISIQIGTCGVLANGNSVRVFIDLNRDGDFADAGETAYTSAAATGASTFTGTIAIPSTGIVAGVTKMRVVSSETVTPTAITACNTTLVSLGEVEDYDIRIGAIPATPVPTYAWSPVSTLDTNAGKINQADSLSASTTYTVVATSGSCALTRTITVNILPLLPSTITSTSPQVCSGQTATLTATPNGGGAPYTFRWYDSTNNNLFLGQSLNATTSSINVTPIQASIYKLVTKSKCGDSVVSVFTMNLYPNPTLTITPYVGSTLQICNTNTAFDTVKVAGADTYTWAAASALFNYALSPIKKDTTIISVGATSVFTVTGTSVNGCTATATAIMNFLPNYNMNVSASPSLVCNGATTALKVTDTLNGGDCISPQPYCYTNLHTGVLGSCLSLVSFNTYTNNAGASCTSNYFADTMSAVTLVKRGTTYPLTANISPFGYAGVWIDYNRNGVYETTEFTAIVNNAPTATVNIPIPTTAAVGCTKMRVRSRSNLAITSGDACTSFDDGKTVDLLITIFDNTYTSLSSSVWSTAGAGVTITPTGALKANASPIPAGSTVFTVQTTDANGCTKQGFTTVTSQPLACNPIALGGATATGPLQTYYFNEFSSATLTNSSLSGVANISGGVLNLFPNTASQYGALMVNPSGYNSSKYQASFRVSTVGTVTNMADGFSYSFGDDVNINAEAAMNAENGTGSKLKVAFVAYTNGTSTNGIYLMYNSLVNEPSPTSNGVLAYSSDVTWKNTANNKVIINVDDFGKVTMTLNGNTIFNNVALPTAYLTTNRANWAHVIKGRTGAVTMSTTLDSVEIKYASNPVNFCVGQTIQVSEAPSNGGTPYTYTWTYNNGSGPVTLGSNVASVSLVPTSAGNYTFTCVVTDACGSSCSVTKLVTVGGLPSATISSSVVPAVVCFSGSINLTANVSGGSAPYAYSWSGTGLSATNTQTVAATPTLPLTNYQVFVSDANACFATNAITVTKSNNFTITAAASVTSLGTCSNTITLLGIDSALAGGSQVMPSPYCAATNSGGTGSGMTNISFGTLNNSSGNVSPYYTNYVGVVGAPNLLLGTTYTLNATVEAAGTYAGAIMSVWIDYNRDALLDASEWQQIAVNQPGGGTASIPITIPVTAQAGLTLMRVRSRGNGNINGSGDACLSMGSGETEDYAVNIIAGTGNQFNSSNFVWTSNNPAAVYIPSNIGDSISANIAAATIFTVTLTDANGCSKTSSVSITQGALTCQAVSVQSSFVCAGQTDSLRANVTGGGQPYTYQWYNASGLIPGATNRTYYPPTTTAGLNTFTVVVTDFCNQTCSSTASFTVQNLPQLSVSTSIPQNLGICGTGTDTLKATSTTIPTITKIKWLPASNITYPNAPDSTKVVISAPGLSASTVYTCILTDQTTLCTNAATINVNYAPNYNVNLTTSSVSNSGCSVDTLKANTLNNFVNTSINTQAGTTGYTANNGSGGITFVVRNNNSFPLPVTAISSYYASAITVASVQLFKSTSSLQGAPGTVATNPAFTLVASATNVPVGAAVQTNLLTGTTSNPVDIIAPNTIVRYYLSATSMPYSGISAPFPTPNSFYNAQANADLYCGDFVNAALLGGTGNVGYGGATTPANTPRFFNGSVTFGYNFLAYPVTAYTWSSNPVTVISGLNSPLDSIVATTPAAPSTTYTVVGTNAIGCTSTKTISLGVGSVVCDSIKAKFGTICIGQTDTIKVYNHLGSTPYIFKVNDGVNPVYTASSSTIVVSPSATTTYTITTYSPCGDSCAQTKTIVVNPVPTISSVTVSDSILCFTGSDTLTVTASGNGPLSYLWSGGTPSGGSSNTSATTVVTPGSTEVYTIKVTDANGCTTTATTTVLFAPLFNIDLIQNATSNAGCSFDTIAASTQNNLANTSINTQLNSSGYTANNGSGGITFAVRNNNSFPLPITFVSSYYASAITVAAVDLYKSTSSLQGAPGTVATNPAFTLVASATNVPVAAAVQSNLLTGSVTNPIDVVPPNTVVRYYLSASSMPYSGISAPFPTPNAFFNVQANADLFCGDYANATLLGGAGVVGYGGATTPTNTPRFFNGSVGFGYNFLTYPVTNYTWTSSSPASVVGVNSPLDSIVATQPTVSTVYTVTATNSIGCSVTKTTSIAVGSVVCDSIYASASSICQGYVDTLIAYSHLGSPPYTYVLKDGVNPDITQSTNKFVVNVANTTTYTIITYSSCGDSCVQTKTINTISSPVITLSSSNNSGVVCTIPQTATINATCLSCTSYAWTGPSSFSPSATVPNVSVTVNNYGTTSVYTVVGTAANGCTSSATKTFATSLPHNLNVTASNTLVCNGATTQLYVTDTSLDAGPATQPGGYCTQAATSNIDEEIVNFIFPAINGYPNQISNASTCANQATGTQGTGTIGAIANSYTNWTNSTVPIPNIVNGTNYNFTLDIGTCGGNFSNSAKIFIDFNRDGDFLDANENVYASTATVLGPNTINGTISVPTTGLQAGVTRMRVIAAETPPANINACDAASGGLNFTWGEVEDYLVRIVTIAQVNVLNYTWSPATTPANGDTVTSPVLTNNPTTIFVTGTDTLGCSFTDSIKLQVNPALTSTVTTVSPTCNGYINGAITVNVSGGTPFSYGYSYLWNSNQTSNMLSTVGGGLYILTATDSLGCTKIDSVTLVDPAPLSVSVVVTGASCGGSGAINAYAIPTGGTAPYCYTWLLDANTPWLNTSGPCGDTALSMIADTTYLLFTQDANGCFTGLIYDTVFTTTPAFPITFDSLVVNAYIACNGGANGSITAYISGGNPAYEYNLNGTGYVSGNTFTGLSAGTYTVTAKDNNGCTVTATISITEPSALSASISSLDVSCNGGSNGSATASGSGGTAPYGYVWTGGPSTDVYSGLLAGTYTVTVTDNNLCSVTSSVVINEPSALSLSSTVISNVSCNGGSNGSAAVTASGGVGQYSYTWNTVSGSDTNSSLSAGIYTVVVTDGNLCTASSTALITEPQALVLSIDSATTSSCAGAQSGQIAASASGGTNPVTMTISPDPNNVGAVSSPYNWIGLGSGTYTIVATDGNGCSNSITVAIQVSTGTSVSITSNLNPAYTLDDVVLSAIPNTFVSYAWSGPTNPSGTSDTIQLNDVFSSASGVYQVIATDGNGCTSSASINLLVNASVQLNAKVFLSGPYSTGTGLMGDGLRTSGVLAANATSEPYSAAPYNTIFVHVNGGGGETIQPGVLSVTGVNAIVDWVFVQLRSAADSTQVVATKSALVQRDGDVVSSDGVSPLLFKLTSPGNYFVSIKHRNHLGIMPLSTYALGETPSSVDLTPQSLVLYNRPAPFNNNFAYNNTQDAYTRVFAGVRALYGGNCNLAASGNPPAYRFIRYNGVSNDRASILSILLGQATATLPGYHKEDLNMDGVVKYNGAANDRLVLLQAIGANLNNTIHEQTPN